MVYIIWGSTYLAIRFSVETIPPLLSGGIRFLAAGAILLAVRLFQTRELPTVRGWKLAFCASLLPFAVTYGLITTAELVVPSSIAGISSDHTDAAIITPAANPRKMRCAFSEVCFLKNSTSDAPSAVIKNVNPVPIAADRTG